MTEHPRDGEHGTGVGAAPGGRDERPTRLPARRPGHPVRVALRWVLFDMNGTLLDPAGIGAPLGLDAESSLGALDEAVLFAMAETLSGSYRPLSELLGAALARRAEAAGAGVSGLDAALERAARMPPFADAAAALARLREAGLAVGVLTNTATAAAEAALEAAGLRAALELVVGTDQVGAFKPHPRVYQRGCERAGCAPDEACLVATHGWDVMGAARAGLRTGWVARRERALSRAVPAPDVRGGSLLELAEGVARLG